MKNEGQSFRNEGLGCVIKRGKERGWQKLEPRRAIHLSLILGWAHVWAKVNRAAMNTGEGVACGLFDYSFLQTCPGGTAGNHVGTRSFKEYP